MTSPLCSPIQKAARQLILAVERDLRELGLAPGEAQILCHAHQRGTCRVAELQRVLGIKRSTLSSMLDRLEQRGWIRRTVHVHDRRSVDVAITTRGGKIAARVQASHERLEKAILRCVRAEDVAGFHRVLAAIEETTGIDMRYRSNPVRQA